MFVVCLESNYIFIVDVRMTQESLDSRESSWVKKLGRRGCGVESNLPVQIGIPVLLKV